MSDCQCGCGQAITPKRWHKYTKARFITGHHVILAAKQGRPHRSRYVPTPEETPSGLCECGCGKPTNPSPDTFRKERHFQGYPLPFLPGHAPARLRRGKASHKWKGGRCMGWGGYILIYAPNHPRASSKGYMLEHRLVMEEHLGRPLESHEIVHHINGDKADNRRKNLVVITKSGHSLLHDLAGKMRRHLTHEIRSAAGKKGAASKWSKRIKSIE